MTRGVKIFVAAALALGATSGTALAGDPEACKTVKFSDVGWTDITATTAIASRILVGLGYTPKTTVLSVPVTYASMKSKDIDVFLGNWQPSMENDRKAYIEDKSVIETGANLPEGAKYTLAVPQYTYDKGLHDFGDITKFKDSLKGKIYGIEPGNDGNRLVQSLIDGNKDNLKDFKLVESSEQGMLAEVQGAVARKEDIVFLGWAPHPMNVNFKIQYLTGGDDTFGPNFGSAIVYTNERAGWAGECPNAGKFVGNLKFNVDLENTVMNYITGDGMEGPAAAEKYLKANPGVLDAWLAGVTTFDGQPGLAAVKKSLGL
ncbi:choline ABC transporter substrate-binding protein [Methylovirgula sp. 4M-Z18]|uniref:choline ABC transporter substrate-binding protein n=1 Tax=Methylovirgula sp. 4M-Z18 TaxID=2293567 RepID=UPI000E2EE447|nr:choline ABC transporter substrate-binding protein [Methylovirgula sp. 4M-Z18]RFB80569.1 choline ABC transporter substrate-binding protein [Methylovirgula sp. 4M-Z18]